MAKPKQAELSSPSYMELGIHQDGEESLILRVPTFWDDIENQWIGAVQTPKTKRIISATGKDSLQLQNNFNRVMGEAFHDPKIADEIFSMFKPLYVWEASEKQS